MKLWWSISQNLTNWSRNYVDIDKEINGDKHVKYRDNAIETMRFMGFFGIGRGNTTIRIFNKYCISTKHVMFGASGYVPPGLGIDYIPTDEDIAELLKMVYNSREIAIQREAVAKHAQNN